MDKKIMAVIAAVIIVAAAAAVVLVKQNDSDDYNIKTTIVGQVNTQGSGMFAKEGLDLASTENGKVTFNDENWNKIVVLTPGPSSIQHVQLQQIVTQTLKYGDKNYEFVMYKDGTTKKDGVVYWVQMSTAGMVNDFINKSGGAYLYDAGFIWEPVYTQALMNKERPAVPVFLTNDLYPDHACCVVSANTTYLNNNSDAVTAFLAGYCNAVDFINDAKKNKPAVMPTLSKTMNGADVLKQYGNYAYVVWLGMNKCNMDQAVVEEALEHVTYTFANGSTDLSKLKGEVADLVNDFLAMGTSVINKPLSATGCDTAEEFADKFIDGTYLENAMDFNEKVDKTISVAVISGDIHQLAIHLAIDQGMFAEYGLNVKINTASNGAGVANLLLSGDSDLGFLGAPPASIITINFA